MEPRTSGSKEQPKTRSAPCTLLAAHLAVSHPSFPLPTSFSPSFSIPKSQILSLKSRVTPMGSIEDSQNRGKNTEVKALLHILQLLFKLFCFPFSSEDRPCSHSVLSSQTRHLKPRSSPSSCKCSLGQRCAAVESRTKLRPQNTRLPRPSRPPACYCNSH